jgi:hypothetical protein
MPRGRPPRCPFCGSHPGPFCGSHRSQRKGHRRTKNHGHPADKALQGLQTQVHTETSKASRTGKCDPMNIITLAFDLAKAVESFAKKVKKFFYSVMLFSHQCPRCNGRLVMVTEGRCQCSSCGDQFDPTVAFQKCTSCGGTAALKVRRYRCSKCGSDITSRLLFDGLVFNVTYFRQKMAE